MTCVKSAANPKVLLPTLLMGPHRRLVVAMAGRAVHVYTPVGLTLGCAPEQTRESSLAHQSRCVRCLPDGTGYAMSSVEGRVAWWGCTSLSIACKRLVSTLEAIKREM